MNTSNIKSALYQGNKFILTKTPNHTTYCNPNKKQKINSIKPLTLLPAVKYDPSFTIPGTLVKSCAGSGVYVQQPASNSRHRAVWIMAGIIWLMLIVQSVAWGQTTLATFNFENNLDPESGAIGSPTLNQNSTFFTNSTVCQGTYSLGADAAGDYVELTISTTGYENITIQWNGRYAGSNDWNGGNQWRLTGDYGTGFGGTLLTQNLSTSCSAASFNLASSFNNNPSINIRITYTDGGRDGRLDELIVTGDAICIPTAGDPNLFGTDTWNVYAFNGGSIDLSGTSYRGFYTEPNLTFNSSDRWNDLLSPSSASGYQGCSVNVDDFTFVYKRKGFPCGTYQIDVPDHDDDARLYINGSNVWEHLNCCDSHTNVWTGVLDANSTVEFRVQDGTGNSLGALTFTLLPAAANFSASQNTVTLGNNVTFHDLSTGKLTSWLWSFPGGTPSTSTDPNPVVTYNTLGTYDVSLSVKSCGSDLAENKTGYISVIVPPACGSGTIWSENFTYSDGTSSGTGSPSGVTTWTTNTGTGYFNVQSEALTGNNANNILTWVTTAIDLSGYTGITASMDISQSGDMENTGTYDYISCQYSTNGGISWTDFTNGYYRGNFSSITATANIGTTASLMLRVAVRESAGDEYHYLNNIVLTGTPIAPIVDDPDDLAQCASEITSVAFTGAAVYLWTNDNTNIGLDDSGIGNISFTTADIPGQEIANLTVIPSNGSCTGTPQLFTITVNPSPFSEVVSTQNISCYDGEDGAITIHGGGGASPYFYSIDNGETWESSPDDPYTFSGLRAKKAYKIRVKDYNTCESPEIQ